MFGCSGRKSFCPDFSAVYEVSRRSNKKELLPVVFEQIKEQAGIDILGWATPKLNANTISGIPILESSNLLRAGETEVRVTPDSIISTLQGQKLKIVFKDQDAKYLPIEVLGDKQLVIDLPAEINVFVGEANFMNLYFNSELVKGGIFGMLPSFSLNAKFTLGDSEKMDLLSASLIQGKPVSMLILLYQIRLKDYWG